MSTTLMVLKLLGWTKGYQFFNLVSSLFSILMNAQSANITDLTIVGSFTQLLRHLDML